MKLEEIYNNDMVHLGYSHISEIREKAGSIDEMLDKHFTNIIIGKHSPVVEHHAVKVYLDDLKDQYGEESQVYKFYNDVYICILNKKLTADLGEENE